VAEAHFSVQIVKKNKLMIIFLYGQDSFRSKVKLDEIINEYKKVHKSGLNLIYINAEIKNSFDDFLSGFKVNSMFSEKKLIIVRSFFGSLDFQEKFSEEIKEIENSKDIVVIYQEGQPDKRLKAFKALQKMVKCQEFDFLSPVLLSKWTDLELQKYKSKIDSDAKNILLSFIGNDLWRLSNEIKKLSDFKKGSTINRSDVELLVKPNIESDIFKTIDALASKNKQQAMSLIHRHINNGDNVLYILSMIAYQFKNLLIIKDMIEKKKPYGFIAKESGIHPFVIKKNYYVCSSFSFLRLKEIYHKIFEIDLAVKTGKIDPETAIDVLISDI